jgi:hypothetical protein
MKNIENAYGNESICLKSSQFGERSTAKVEFARANSNSTLAVGIDFDLANSTLAVGIDKQMCIVTI